jgi:dCTP deaminase
MNPNSYNLRLSNELLVYESEVLDMKSDNKFKIITIPEEGYLLEPNKLYLGRTVEYVKTDKYIPMLEGRSSIGRLGMFIHITAGLGNVGMSGYWTLEIVAVQPLIIYPNVAVCQLFFHTVNGEFKPYSSGKYHENNGIQPSFLYKELV